MDSLDTLVSPNALFDLQRAYGCLRFVKHTVNTHDKNICTWSSRSRTTDRQIYSKLSAVRFGASHPHLFSPPHPEIPGRAGGAAHEADDAERGPHIATGELNATGVSPVGGAAAD